MTMARLKGGTERLLFYVAEPLEYRGLGRCRFARAVEPREAGLLAEPDQLPLGVAAVFLDDERSRSGLVAHAVQVFERLTIHQPAERTRVVGDPVFEQRPHLVE